MPCTPEAVQIFRKASVLIAPAMAAGAGGVRLKSLHTYSPHLNQNNSNIDDLSAAIFIPNTTMMKMLTLSTLSENVDAKLLLYYILFIRHQ